MVAGFAPRDANDSQCNQMIRVPLQDSTSNLFCGGKICGVVKPGGLGSQLVNRRLGRFHA
jgi:hypothetical protein